MTYVSGSTPTVSGYDTQGPKPLPPGYFTTADSPGLRVIQAKESSQIILHGTISASFHFCVATGSGEIDAAVPLTNTSCVNGTVSTIGNAVNVGADDGDAGITVPLNANVWSGSGAAPVQGAVSFIYKGGV